MEIDNSKSANLPPIHKDDLLSFKMGDHLFLQTPDGTDLVALNSVAQIIWEARKEGLGLESITDRLVKLFGISQQQAREDILGAFESWKKEGLFTQRSSNPPIPSASDISELGPLQ